MTYQELLKENTEQKQKVAEQQKKVKEQSFKIELLQTELSNIKKLIYGSKRERFTCSEDENQTSLFDIEAIATDQTEVIEKTVTVKKTKRKAPKTFKRNQFPAHLQREETIIEPEAIDLKDYTKIGENVTETLAYKPAQVFVNKTVRPKYVLKSNEDAGVKQAKVPARLIPSGIVDESLIAALICEKILHHTPAYRFNKKLKQAGINFISNSNLYNWFHKGAESLLALQDLVQQDLLKQTYLQADETTIIVLNKNKKDSSHRGYIWVLYCPKLKLVLYLYHPSRSKKAGEQLLKEFKEIVQADGYEVYESLAQKNGFELIFCMAHARRKFVEAKNNDPVKAEYFLQKLQLLYRIERRARGQDEKGKQIREPLNNQQRLALRQKEAVPILQELGIWLKAQFTDGKVLPKSSIGKAIAYSLKRWKGLSAYAYNGALEIDNNLIENTIRPIALGRKNYLFAGNHKAAANLACLYTIVGTAKQHNLNIQKYLTWLLKKVATEKMTDENLKSCLPYNFTEKQLQEFKL